MFRSHRVRTALRAVGATSLIGILSGVGIAQEYALHFDRRIITTDSGVRVAAVLDANRDGLADVAVGRATAKISVFQGLVSGQLDGGTGYATGGPIRSGGAADLDADGFDELVVTDSGLGAFITYRTTPSGLVPSSTVPLPVQLGNFRFGDVNLDGMVDVVALEATFIIWFAQPYIFSLLSNGSGGLTLGQTTTAAMGAFLFDVGDLNLDGRADVVTAAGQFFGMNYQLSSASGLSAPQLLPGLSTACSAIALFDVQEDGLLDIVHSEGSINLGFQTALQSPGLVFSSSQSYASSIKSPRLFEVWDVTGDGKKDLIATTQFFGGEIEFAVLQRDGAGGLAVAEQKQGVGLSTAPRFGDLNLDGVDDIIAASKSTVNLYLSQIGGNHQAQEAAASVASAETVALGDFDGNGRLDAVVGGIGAASLGIHFDAGLSSTAPPVAMFPTPPPTILNRVRAADVNADGKVDVLGAAFVPAQILQFVNSGGTFAPPSDLPLAATFREFELGDWNADGMLDLIVLLDYPASPSVMLGPLNPSPQGTVSIGAPGDASCMAIGDADGDGALDLAIGTLTGSVWLFTQANGLSQISSITYTSVKAIAMADFNGDQRADIASHRASNSGGEVRLHSTTATPGAFVETAQSTLTNSSTSYILSIDANGDAVRDLAIGPSGDLMQVFLAPPAGIQSLGAIATANIRITDIAGGNSDHGPPAAGDLDGNGRIDFVTPAPTNSTVTFLRNTAPQPIGVASYGNSSAGCAGLEGLAASSSPKLGNSQFRIVATQSPPSSLGLLLLADAQDAAGSNALGLGIQLHVNPLASTVLLGRDLRSDLSGYAVAEIPVPSTPALAGATYFAQGLFAWGGSCPLGPFGLSATSALVIAVQP